MIRLALAIVAVMIGMTPVWAERTCSRTVTTSEGTKVITVECSAQYTKDTNPDIVRNPRILDDKTDDLMQKVNDHMQQVRDKTTDRSSTQVMVDQKAADIRQKERDAIEAVRLKQQK